MKHTIADALQSLKPGGQWAKSRIEYSGHE